jgi:multimeric flavodoxin WrbA
LEGGMVKVLLVNGSPRKGNTLKVVEKIEAELKIRKIETEILHIIDNTIKTCIGCYKCVLVGKEECPFGADDTEIIWQKFLSADGIVLSAPVFALGVPGYFKNFMDRVAYNAHRPEMYNKPALIASTTAGMGTENVIRQLKWFKIAGLKIVSSIGFLVYPIGNDSSKVVHQKQVKIRKIIDKFEKSLHSKGIIRPTLIQVIQYYGLKLNSVFGKSAYLADYEYYKSREFFVDAKINPIKKALGKMVYGIGARTLAKTIVQPRT